MITRAMIFCAGLGTRFKPWTDKHPKALAMVNGKSLLQRNIEYLQAYGICEVVVNVHHFSDQIIRAVQENNGWGSEITISDETSEVLETGGGVLFAADYFKDDASWLVMNADILTTMPLDKMMAADEADQETNTYLIAFIAAVGAFSLAAMLMFKNRKTQLLLTSINYVLILGCIAMMYLYSLHMDYFDGKGTQSIEISAVLPIMLVIFNFLAGRGVNKDMQLIRSMDRLR